MSIYVVFYKDRGLGAKLIQWWTHSNYNHIEIWTGTELIGVPSNAKAIRRQEQVYLNPKKWTVYEVKDMSFIHTLNSFFEYTKGLKYDNKAIWLSNVFNRGEQEKNKYTCSEWVSELLDKHYNIIYPHWFSKFSPQDVLDVILDKDLVNPVKLTEDGQVEKRWRTDV